MTPLTGFAGIACPVSPLAFGVAAFGTGARGAGADGLLGRFLDAGGTLVDTAHCYAFWLPNGDGASERELGAAIRRLRCRERLILGTKGGHPALAPGYPRPAAFLSPARVRQDLDESLERLGVDHVDLYWLHRDDGVTPAGEIIEMLNEEIRRGRILAPGASNWSSARIAEANAYAAVHGLAPFCASQVQWSLATPSWVIGQDPTVRYVTPSDRDACARLGVPIVAYTSASAGFFAGRGTAAEPFCAEENRARLDRARSMAAARGWTPTQVAIAWLLAQQPPAIPLFSSTNPEHLEEALGALNVKLTAAEADWLERGV